MSENHTTKIRVMADQFKIGDKIAGAFGIFEITGLGKIWTEYPTDEDSSVYGLLPGLDYYPPIKFQNAYCVEV